MASQYIQINSSSKFKQGLITMWAVIKIVVTWSVITGNNSYTIVIIDYLLQFYFKYSLLIYQEKGFSWYSKSNSSGRKLNKEIETKTYIKTLKSKAFLIDIDHIF